MPNPQRCIAPWRSRTAAQRCRPGAAGGAPAGTRSPRIAPPARGALCGARRRRPGGFPRAALLAALALALLPVHRVDAVELKIEAPSFTFDSERRTYRYQEARISVGDVSLEAQEVLINEQAGTLMATGALRMRSGPLFISADRLDLDIETQSGTVTNARVFDSQTGYYMKAATMNVLPNRVFAASCTLTSCPPLVPGWKLVVRDLDYRVDEFAVGRNALIELGDTPVFWLPVMAWPTVTKRRSGVLAPVVSSRAASLERFNLGTRFGVPYFLDLSPSQDLTLTPEYIEHRGTALMADYRYAFHGDQVGRLELWGLSEDYNRVPGRENDILAPGEAEQRSKHLNRYTLDYGHNEGIGDSSRIVFSTTGSSDGQVRREYQYVENYRPDLIYQGTYSHQAAWGDTAVSVEHASEFTAESVYANSSAFTNGQNRPLLAPRLSYGQGWRPFSALPFGVELTGAVTQFQADADASGNALFARPSLAVPVQLGEGFEMRGQFARQFAGYNGLTGQDQFTGLPVPKSEGFSQNESQLEVRGTFAGVYHPAGGLYDAVKHRIVPRLLYDEVEDVHQPLTDRLLRARIAERLATFRLDNSFIGELRGRPAAPVTDYEPTNLSDTSRFNFLHQNEGAIAAAAPPGTVQRGPTEEFANVSLIQRYNFLLESRSPSVIGPALPAVQETTPGNPLLPAIFEAGYGRGGLSLNFETHYHHQLQRVTETAIGMSAQVRRFTHIAIGYSENEFSYRTPENKLHPVGNVLSTSGEIEVADTLSLGFGGTVDLRDLPAPLGRRVQTSEFFLDFHPICYRIRLSVRDSLEVTQTNGVDQYFTSQRVLLTFSIGNILSTSREQVVSTGAPR